MSENYRKIGKNKEDFGKLKKNWENYRKGQ